MKERWTKIEGKRSFLKDIGGKGKFGKKGEGEKGR